jgi:hypothetical protein
MKYLLGATLLSYVALFFALGRMNAPGAEFDTAMPAFVSVVVSGLLSMAYIVGVLWFHELW